MDEFKMFLIGEFCVWVNSIYMGFDCFCIDIIVVMYLFFLK